MPSRRSKREVIHIQTPVYTTDAYNQQVISGYTNVLTAVRATWKHNEGMGKTTAGTEYMRGRQVEASVVGSFEIRKPNVAITPAMSVLHVSDGNTRYEIHSVRPSESNYEGGFRDVEILVKGIAE